MLDSQNRSASDEEKRILVKYVGWGGIPQVFASPLSTEWEAEGERLKMLLTSEEYEPARASTLNAHYTSPIVISAIYDAVQRIGFEKVLRVTPESYRNLLVASSDSDIDANTALDPTTKETLKSQRERLRIW